MTPATRLYYSRAELCGLLGLSQRSVDHLLSSGQLRSSKIGRRRVVHVDALKNFAGSEITCRLAG